MIGKTTLLFLHGFMGAARDWQPVMKHLQKDFSCVAVNIPLETSFQKLARALPKTRDAVLIGYSMGGRLALHAALRKKCGALVLISASPGLAGAAERRVRRARDDKWASRLVKEKPKYFLRDWYSQPIFKGLVSRPRRELKNKRSLAEMLRALSPGRQPSQWSKLKGLGVPTLVVSGERDEKYKAIGRAMARLCGQARHVIVPRSSHAVHLDQPVQLARLIRSFVSEVTHE